MIEPVLCLRNCVSRSVALHSNLFVDPGFGASSGWLMGSRLASFNTWYPITRMADISLETVGVIVAGAHVGFSDVGK